MSTRSIQKSSIKSFLETIIFDGYNLVVIDDDTQQITRFPHIKIYSGNTIDQGYTTHQQRYVYAYELVTEYQLDGETVVSDQVIDELEDLISQKIDQSRAGLQNINIGNNKVWYDMRTDGAFRREIAVNKRRLIIPINCYVISNFR